MDIQAAGDLTIDFVDGYEGCEGATVVEDEATDASMGPPGPDEVPATDVAPVEAAAADKPADK